MHGISSAQEKLHLQNVEHGIWHRQMPINGAFEYDFTLLPTGDEGTSTSTIGGENFGVCKGSENKEACAKFLEWLCSQENEANGQL